MYENGRSDQMCRTADCFEQVQSNGFWLSRLIQQEKSHKTFSKFGNLWFVKVIAESFVTYINDTFSKHDL